MKPRQPLPHPECWGSTEEYVSSLLEFASSSDMFQTLCGGVHILDFFTNEPGLFQATMPAEWQAYLLQAEPMRLLDLLMRDEVGPAPASGGRDGAQDGEEGLRPPESLTRYIADIRRFSLGRDVRPEEEAEAEAEAEAGKTVPELRPQVATGMKPKKMHEVAHFARYVDRLAAGLEQDITHFVDLGSGQSYLGRALASAPYNKHIVAVEGREHNIASARELDVVAGLAGKEKMMRNKKLWNQQQDALRSPADPDSRPSRRAARNVRIRETTSEYAAELGPARPVEPARSAEDGRGFIRHMSGRLESGDLSGVVDELERAGRDSEQEARKLRLMAVSIHSCGNLSHHGIHSLVMNPDVRAVAIVGCCYNLLTEKLGPRTYKYPYMRPSLQALNGRLVRESERRDPQGFPMSERLSTYKGDGIRLNITARMMACQAPQNWGEEDSDGFFTRHYYRAVLQKIFLDRGVIRKIYHNAAPDEADAGSGAFNMSTNPVIIGSLRKSCYKSFATYVRGAITKLTTSADYHEHCAAVSEKMGDMTDGEIARYEEVYRHRKRELSAIWSLMAFSAAVVESLIVTDRWLFLRQHEEVQDAWVEAVFDYRQSPRNLVVVGVKRAG